MKQSVGTQNGIPYKHHRRSIRLKDYDYSQAGGYFITIDSWRHEPIFGQIVNAVMMLNEIGNIVNDEWYRTPRIRPNVELDEFVIMPDHIHGIIIINENGTDVTQHRRGVSQYAPTEQYAPTGKPAHAGESPSTHTQLRSPSRTVGAIIRGFKSATTKRINEIRCEDISQYAPTGNPVWQRNYWEHIIRDENELNRIRQYIVDNPMKWEMKDKEWL